MISLANVFGMLPITHIYDDIEPWIPSLISCFSAMISGDEISNIGLPKFPCLRDSLPEFYLSSEEKFVYLSFEKMIDTIFFTLRRQLLHMLFAIIFFHCSEYIIAISIHGKNNVTLKSLLISKNYIMAMVFSLIEYLVEIYFFPGLKQRWLPSNIGLTMVVFGEVIRKLAIITAGRSFTHLIRIHHEGHHVLVRHGVYRYLRHPSYCRFLIWSVGTQIMVCNPLSTLAFAFIVWRFFQQRIPYEEFFLRQFFGLEYEDYTDQTFSGIPFIK